MAGISEKLCGLLDYVEQVVRLDEKIAYRLSDYRLPDGTTFALHPADTSALPGIRHNLREDGEAVWLEIDRLSRQEPPAPGPEIADWISLSPDPSQPPQIKQERLVTVSAAEKDKAIAEGKILPVDVMEAPRSNEQSTIGLAPQYDLRLRLSERPDTAAAIEIWIAGPWTDWATREVPRRKTISVYQKLYKVFQTLETGATESPIEIAWGIGLTYWKADGRVIERPLLERRVEIELDDSKGGLIRVSPTTAPTSFDLKHFEEVGCDSTASIGDLIQRELRRVEEDDGVSPYLPETFDAILSAVASRLHAEGAYVAAPTSQDIEDALRIGKPLVSGQWVLFARPRSQHIVLQDITRLKKAATDAKEKISGLAASLVSEPSATVSGTAWTPLSVKIGGTTGSEQGPDLNSAEEADVFFPKPFNADQVQIIRRLEKSDGLVVQGPPGTGKTHTIANLICHSMATGRRVLVVSRGESALSVLREQLPAEVQPLAIAVMTSERQGLRQIESAIRQVQAIVDESKPENRRSTIVRLEGEIAGLQQKIHRIDEELDEIAAGHLTKVGPGRETPAELSKRIVAEREIYSWLSDRPGRFAADSGLSDQHWSELDESRRRAGDFIDHSEAKLPASQDLPSGAQMAAWHSDIVRAAELAANAKAGPAPAVHVTLDTADDAGLAAQCLEDMGHVHAAWSRYPWLKAIFSALSKGTSGAWVSSIQQRVSEWKDVEAQSARLAEHSVQLADDLLHDDFASDAIERASKGERPWPILHVGRSASKALISEIKLDGMAPRSGDVEGWRHISAVVRNRRARIELFARWNGLVRQLGGLEETPPDAQLASADQVLRSGDSFRKISPILQLLFPIGFGKSDIVEDPAYCSQLAAQLRSAQAAIRLAQARSEVERVRRLFEGKTDRTAILACEMTEAVVGSASVEPDKVEQFWNNLLTRLDTLGALRGSFETIIATTRAISDAGCPLWAEALRTRAVSDSEPVLASTWRAAWDFGAAECVLTNIDARQRLSTLSQDRETVDKQRRKLLGELVRERTFYELNRRLSPSVKSALVEFVRALARIGKGTGKGAGKHRASAREAMARCYDAVPCWIMPTWRVAEQLPAEIGAIDLVIIDEASQSDATELPALLRGKKLLVVGDDRQVSPTAPFVTQNKIDQLRHHYLREMPFKSLLEPGESIYDLMRAVFPENRLMLKEHFRCVEPIIRFSMQFYPEAMLPLRIPAADERLEPPLVDIYVPHGVRDLNRKINRPEAEVIVEEIKALTSLSGKPRSIGVISLIGAEQAEFIRARLSETVGEEVMQRHSLLCGDSATFQGTERDVVYLSMVADPLKKSALTALPYEQRFNVAVSRARDRAVLVRSVRREELKPADLKARLIAHFENPMPSQPALDHLERCESDFERDVLGALLAKGYRASAQVGTIGYRIDIVVEGANGRRLAVECDGDRFHGPEQWRHDMTRQRVLERIGWRFWRCFASSFYRDRDAVIGDLFATLERFGIEPLGTTSSAHRFTEFRVVTAPTSVCEEIADEATAKEGIGLGDRLNLIFADDRRRISVRLTSGSNDLAQGLLSVSSPIGRAVLGAGEGDEVEVELENGQRRVVLVDSVLRQPTMTEESRLAAE
jgi:very-short-patch-repair endonuclease